MGVFGVHALEVRHRQPWIGTACINDDLEVLAADGHRREKDTAASNGYQLDCAALCVSTSANGP